MHCLVNIYFYLLLHIVPVIDPSVAMADVDLGRPWEFPQNLFACLALAIVKEAHIVPNLAPGISMQSYPLVADSPLLHEVIELKRE